MRGEPSLGRRDVHCTRLVPIPLTNVEDDVLRRRSPLELPLLGSNQDSPDPIPLRLSPPLRERSWSGLCLHLRRYAVRWLPLQSLHLPLSGLGSALPIKGPPTSRAFTHAISGVVSSERTVRCR